GLIKTAMAAASFVAGQRVGAAVFEIDICEGGNCYTPNNFGVLNTPAVGALHSLGDKVIGYIDAGTAETWRPDYPQYQSFNASCGGCLFGKAGGGVRGRVWLDIKAEGARGDPDTRGTEEAH